MKIRKVKQQSKRYNFVNKNNNKYFFYFQLKLFIVPLISLVINNIKLFSRSGQTLL